MELLKHTSFDIEDDGSNGQDKIKEAINSDIELFEEKRKQENQSTEQPTNEQLLTMLGERLARGEIKRELGQLGNFLMIDTEQGIFKVDLNDGTLTPNPVELEEWQNKSW